MDAFLSALRAGGGGESPEDVLSGLAAALGELDWDESPGTDRQLFLQKLPQQSSVETAVDLLRNRRCRKIVGRQLNSQVIG